MNSDNPLIKCTPSSEELSFLEDRLYEFNRAQTGQDDGQLFAFFVRDDAQELVARIAGWTWAGACEVQLYSQSAVLGYLALALSSQPWYNMCGGLSWDFGLVHARARTGHHDGAHDTRPLQRQRTHWLVNFEKR